ncbi:hypothetical protein DWX43_17175 [Clostridium sp. AF19-22AC]|nr:hypothetical protein DWX43_17175 [Clostridium sp. AF19-22AC]
MILRKVQEKDRQTSGCNQQDFWRVCDGTQPGAGPVCFPQNVPGKGKYTAQNIDINVYAKI